MRATRLINGLLTATLLLALQAVTVSAQAPSRDGFFIGFGLGLGTLGFEDADERESAVSGYFKIGGALNEQLSLGAETNGWRKEEAGVTLTSTNISAVAYVYPSPDGGFYLKGGLGLANVDVDLGGFGGGDENGVGLTLGAGYDIGFGGRFGLTPYANLIYSSFDGGSSNLFQFGLG
ncbi:MAG: autotransporter domain-containing protein, partial [Longimicrobiales bacterium]|nr:autotransporter domain-containing protein [Longimicrobiales bacterium]